VEERRPSPSTIEEKAFLPFAVSAQGAAGTVDPMNCWDEASRCCGGARGRKWRLVLRRGEKQGNEGEEASIPPRAKREREVGFVFQKS
jgi:hypothetical protein